MSKDHDDPEYEYGEWEFTIDDALKEAKARNPHSLPPEIWPSWHDGVPSVMRRSTSSGRFTRNGVTYRPRSILETVDLDWDFSHLLSDLAKDYRYLPSDTQSQWSGVYRVFVTGKEIGRLLGRDSTGTLYLGMAGEGKGKWSIMRYRVMGLATRRNHQVADRWYRGDELEQQFPWKNVRVQWAFTKPRMNHEFDEVAGAKLAETYLLWSYRDTFGELPPFNEKT